MSLADITKYINLIWFSFTRHEFYVELADCWQRRVSLKNFAYRIIENGKTLNDSNRVYIGKKLVANIEQNETVGLWASIKSIVPKNDWPLLKAAEVAKDIPAAILHLAKVISFKINITKQSLGTAMVVAVATALSAGIMVLTADTIKQVIETVPGMKFTGFNGFVVFTAMFLMEYWKPVCLGLLILTALIIFYLPRMTGPVREKLDEWPVLCLYRDLESANAIAALSMFLSSGLVLKDALIRLSADGSPWRKWQVSKITNSLDNRPNELMKAFSKGLFAPKLRARLASLSDSSSAFEEAIIKLGRDELARIEKEIQTTVVAAGSSLVFLVATVAVILSLGQQTIISQLYNEFSKGY